MSELAINLIFVQKLVFALVLGALMGMEREHSKQQALVGIRTFALISLFGAIIVLFGELISFEAINALGFLAVLIFSYNIYIRREHKRIGPTTSLAIVLCYVVGVFAGYSRFVEAVFAAIVITIVLFAKERLHNIVDKLTHKELLDFLEFLVIIGVVYPLLPAQPLSYAGVVIDLHVIWFLVVLISVINFVGFVGSRFFSAEKQLEFMSFLGGLVSSTAICSNLPRVFKNKYDLLASGFLFINSAMVLRNLAIIGIVLPSSLVFLGVPSLVTAALLVIMGLWLMRKHKVTGKMKVESPFGVVKAVQFVLALFVVIIVLQAILAFIPEAFFFAVLVGAVVSSSSTVASVAVLALENQVSLFDAVIAVAVVTVVNMCVGNLMIYHFCGAKKAVKKILPFIFVATVVFVGLLALFI